MADGALLLVDAAEGPLPQTRFVLSKALELGMPVVVVINKVDRPDARHEATLEDVFSLFCDLEASDEQANFPVVYAVGRDGVAMRAYGDERKSLEPLMDTIVEKIPAPQGDPGAPLAMLVHDVQHDDYVGRLAIGRIHRGRLRTGRQVALLQDGGEKVGKVAQVFAFEGLRRVKADEAEAGDIVAVAGFEDVQIGDTLSDPEMRAALPRIVVEQPTIKVTFRVND